MVITHISLKLHSHLHSEGFKGVGTWAWTLSFSKPITAPWNSVPVAIMEADGLAILNVPKGSAYKVVGEQVICSFSLGPPFSLVK